MGFIGSRELSLKWRRVTFPIFRHQDAVFKDLLHLKPGEAVKDDEVCPVARSNRSKTLQPEIFRSIEGCHPDRQDRRGSQADRLSDHRIDMAFFEEFPGMAVVRDKEKTPRILGGDEGEEVLQVSCRCSLPHHDPHPVLQFLFCFFLVRSLMVRANPGNQISI